MHLESWDRDSKFGILICIAKIKKRILLYYDLPKRKIDKMFSKSRLLFTPYSIQLEPTTKCNLKCSFCNSTYWDRKGMDMSITDFKKIIDQFPYLIRLHLQGFGEPLLCKDFFEMVEYCTSKGIVAGTVTNAMALNQRNIRKIIESKLDYLLISMDGATPETYESIRVGSKFDEILRNTRNLVRMRGDLKKPRITFFFTGTNENIHELPEILKLAKEIGVDQLNAQEALCFDNDTIRERIGKNSMQKNIERCKYYINTTMEEAKKIGFPFNWIGGGEKFLDHSGGDNLHASQAICQQLFSSCYITVDGYVTPCSANPDPRIINFGNLLRQNFNEIWNNSQYIQLREEVKKGKIPQFCRECTIVHI